MKSKTKIALDRHLLNTGINNDSEITNTIFCVRNFSNSGDHISTLEKCQKIPVKSTDFMETVTVMCNYSLNLLLSPFPIIACLANSKNSCISLVYSLDKFWE